MKPTKKLTRQYFCSIYDEARKMRKTDPVQFSVMFNNWVRSRKGYL